MLNLLDSIMFFSLTQGSCFLDVDITYILIFSFISWVLLCICVHIPSRLYSRESSNNLQSTRQKWLPMHWPLLLPQ